MKCAYYILHEKWRAKRLISCKNKIIAEVLVLTKFSVTFSFHNNIPENRKSGIFEFKFSKYLYKTLNMRSNMEITVP